MLAGVFPALQRGLHEARHLVDEGRVIEIVLQHVKAVLQGGDALVLVLVDDEIFGRQAGIDNMPVLVVGHGGDAGRLRSEEHTSELQSLMSISYAVFCLKNKKQQTTKIVAQTTS